MLEAHNVPELSAGVNCSFENLAEMDGLVEGNRIRCFSPAEKEVPRIIVDKGRVRLYPSPPVPQSVSTCTPVCVRPYPSL